MFPSSMVLLGAVLLLSPFFTDTVYQNQIAGTGVFLLFTAWAGASLLDRKKLIEQDRWQQQIKSMIAMSLCMSLAIGMLVYYEIQMPKYRVAITNKELYKVPPQLNRKQLYELGSECNTYGNTLCSHAVFAKIVRLDSRDFIALGNLAMAQSHLGFHEFAKENFETAIKYNARTYDIFKFYGHSLKALGMNQRAIEAYQNSLKLNQRQDDLIKRIEELSQR